MVLIPIDLHLVTNFDIPNLVYGVSVPEIVSQTPLTGAAAYAEIMMEINDKNVIEEILYFIIIIKLNIILPKFLIGQKYDNTNYYTYIFIK